MKNHPQLIDLYRLYNQESQSFRKVHRMIDLFESIIKTHTVVILGEYFKQNKYSNAAKGLLASGLRTPSLGTWQLFSRVLYKELIADNHVFFQEDFAKEFEKLDKDLDNSKTNVISFRNEYAHGATPSDELCMEDIKRFEPFLESLLASKWIAHSNLLELEGKVSISNSNTADTLRLYPILLFKPEPNAQPYVFFNDLKNDKVGLLNYPLSKHYREKDFFEEFNTYLPLKEWKNSGSREFYQRIEELTETFKGRTQERLNIREFIKKNEKGYFSIQGNPGIGKSALIAQLFKDLSNQTPKLPIKLVEYFIRRGTAQSNTTYLLNYLIKATDNYFADGKAIQAEGKTNWDLQQQLFAKWRAFGETNPKEKLVFLIDGLDEGVENEILRYLPRENFNQILIIYGSRPGGHKDIEAFWSELPVEHHNSILLRGLSKNDIRALLYEVGNKYQIDKESTWIDSVEERSEGNPLYLKLLCNAIENGSIQFNDTKALPTEINDYYKAILNRYANDSIDGDALLSSLYVFAAAVDYLTPVHLQLINGLGTAQSLRIESTLKEVLSENPLTDEALDYQLFHESFREFLIQFYPTEIKRAETKLLDFCSTWNSIYNTFEQRYTLQHYTTHLSKKCTEQSMLTLINLSKNKQYTDTQKKVLRGFTSSKQLYQDAVYTALKISSTDEALEAALALVDIKYDEQNDAATILAMIANNEIDLALQRITAFGGESKEDKQRQFILYMLCLMEITLLKSKTQPWCKGAIEKLLSQFEEQIPIDYSLVNWNDFFSSYLVFVLAVELAVLELDYLEIYKRTRFWDYNWINEKGPYNDIQNKVLIDSANLISSVYYEKSDTLLDIASVFFSHENFVKSELILQSAIECAFLISHTRDKIRMLTQIAVELFNQNNSEKSNSLMQDSISLFNNIKDDYTLKESTMRCIAIGLVKIGNVNQALEFANGIVNDDYNKSVAFKHIANMLVKLNRIDEAIICSDKISDEFERLSCKLNIADELLFQECKIEAQKMILKILESARMCCSNEAKSKVLMIIFKKMPKYCIIYEEKNIMTESLTAAKDIDDLSDKIWNLIEIIDELAKQTEYENIITVLNIAIQFILEIDNERERNYRLLDIIEKLSQNNLINETLQCINYIDKEDVKYRAKGYLATELANQGKVIDSIFVLKNSLELSRGINRKIRIDKLLVDIVNQNLNQNKIDESIICIDNITSNSLKNNEYLKIYNQLFSNGNIVESAHLMNKILDSVRKLNDYIIKINSLIDIANVLSGNTMYIDAKIIYQEAFDLTNGISFEYNRNMLQQKIAYERVKLEELEKQSILVNEISENLIIDNSITSLLNKTSNKDSLILAELKGLEICITEERHLFWKNSAKTIIQNNDALSSLLNYSKFKNEEARTFYLKGWAEHVTIKSISHEVLCQALPLLSQDTEALEQFLQTYAIQTLFFETPSQAKIQLLNQTLNLQWALEIMAQMPTTQNPPRLTTNLDTWLHEIEDEDDREQVTLWAKQVAKDKISEKEFQEKIKELQ